MATVGKSSADGLVMNNGYYHDDPRVMQIIEYTDMAGNLAYGVEYGHEIGRYAESEFVRNPRVYWKAK